MIDAAKILDAARLIGEAIERADVGEEKCAGCDRWKKDNWLEAQAHTELAATTRKLRGWVRRLRADKGETR